MSAPKRIRRWLRDRCAHCGHRFAYRGDARHSYGNRDGKVYHNPCIGYLTFRSKAEERLAILDLVVDVWNVDERDAKMTIELRAGNGDERIAASNRAFRVFHDLAKFRAIPDVTP